MNEEYIKAIHAAYGEDKLGSYDDFYSEITSNKDYRDLVYNQLGGSDVFGDYNDFTDLVSIKQEQVQEDVKKKDTPQPYQPTSEEPTEVSRTDSGGIDFKALDEILPSNMQEAEEDVKRRIEQKQEQEQVVSSGQKANRVLNEVDKFAQSVDDFSKSVEQTPVLQSEWGPTSFEQATVEKSDEQLRAENTIQARKQFGDDVQAYSQAKLEELKPQLDKEYQNLTGYDNEEFVIEQPDGSLAIDENAYNETTFFSEQFGELYKEVVANEAKSLKDASSIQKAVKTLGIGIDNLDAGIGAWFDPDAYNRTAFYNDAKVAAIKKSFGMTEQDIENGVIKNFTQGNIEAGLRNLTGDVLLNLPQVGVAILGGAVGAPSMLAVAPLGLSAGGSEYARLQSNPNLSEGAKMLIGAYLGAAEIALEGMAMGDIRLARQALSNLSADGRKQLARRIAKDFIKEGSIPVKAGAEEALEEALASVNSQFVESIIDPDKKFDIYEAGDAALVGFSSGAGIGVGNVITKTPSYIASYKNANKRRKVLDAVKKLNDIKSDPSSTEQDIEIANDALLDAKRRLASIEKSDAELYSRMSEGDVDKVISLNRRISRGLDRLDALKQEPESDKRSILKSAIENKLQSDFNEKKEIEKKYEVEDAVEEAPVEEVEGAENTVRTFAERIAKGEDVSSTEDLQFYENNKQEVEDALRQMREAEGVVTETVEEQEPAEVSKEEVLDNLNPTGGLFVNYTPEQRDELPLGGNITTYDKTSGKNPDELVTVYRGVPEDVNEIISGDYVTTNEQLAKDYAGTGKVISKQVRADEILDDKVEPLGEEYILRERKAKKETDAVQEQATGEVPVQPKAEVSGEMEEGVPDTEPQEATQEGKKPRVAKDKKGITSLMERVFGLNKSKSKAAARIYDIAIGTIAERAGITKEEAYRMIGLLKGKKEQLKGKGNVLFQSLSSSVWESTAKRGIEAIKQNAATPEQWVKMITDKGGKGTSQELEWIGLSDFLNDYVKENGVKSVPRDVVEQYINDNQIEIVEVGKGMATKSDKFDIKYNNGVFTVTRNGIEEKSFTEEFSANNYIANKQLEKEKKETKYSQYTLEGGENYREVLLTLPVKKEKFDKINKILEKAKSEEEAANIMFSDFVYPQEALDLGYEQGDGSIAVASLALAQYSGDSYGRKTLEDRLKAITGDKYNEAKSLGEKALELYNESKNKRKSLGGLAYKSSHWDETNILAHLRINERTLPNGERVMFIEEVQSDWAQEGKKKGFKESYTPETLPEKFTTRYRELDGRIVLYENDIMVGSFDSIDNAVEYVNNYGVPQMPYKKTDQWVGMAMRRVFKMAADEGFNRVAWVTGEQSADRYDLSKQVDRVVATKKPNEDEYRITIFEKYGNKTPSQLNLKAEELEANLGKDLAEKIINETTPKQGLEAVLKDDSQYQKLVKERESKRQEQLKTRYSEKAQGSVAEQLQRGKDLSRIQRELNQIENKIESYLNRNYKDYREKSNEYSGLDLKVGGEGMKAFYNSILPKVAKKEAQRFDKKANVEVVDFRGRTRKIDVKETSSSYEFFVDGKKIDVIDKSDAVNSKDEAMDSFLYFNPEYANLEGAGKQLSIAITPEMRMNLNSAIPLFQGEQGAMVVAEDGNYIIYALTDPNVSTPLHELAHVYEHYLTEQERADIEAWSGHKSGTVEFSEAFARGFEKYLADGKAPNDKLQKLFDNFKKWLTEIYDGITGSEIDLELNDKMRGIYDAMLEGENKETARRRQRNTIKEKIDKSVVSKLPFLAKFNPEHSYTVAQAELIDKFIDEYVKTGSLKGSGNVEALINGVSNMASLKQKAKTGFRKIFFKFSYDSKDVNKIRAMSSSTLIAELFGSGFEKVLSAIGGTKWDASVAKSIKDSSNFIANIKPSMDKASATDVGQAGDIKMFAVGFVEQIYQRFVADVGEETAIKTAIRFLEKSIQTQQESRINSETLNLQKEALDLIKDETTIEGVLSKLTDGQRAVYESVIKANDLSIDEVQRISIENGKPLEKQNRYLHIPTRTTKNELKDLTPEEFLTDPDAIGYVNPFDTKIFEKTSGAQEARVKDIQKLSQAFEEGSLYLEPSFILQQHNSFFNTRLAVYSHQAIVQMNAALGAKEARDIFGGKKHNGAENISAVKDVIKRNMNANRISAYTLSNIPVIGGLYMSLKRNAIPLAMGSIVQPIKQGTVVITTAAELTSMVGRREAGSIMARSRIFAFDYFSEKARSKSKGDLFDFKNLPWNDLIMNSQVGVRNTLDALEFSDQLRNISIISSFAPARALRKKWNSFRDYWSAKSIVTPDRAAAQIGWLNYYEAYMIKNGLVEPSSFYKDGSLDADAYRDWYLEQGMNPNQDAVAYASNRILQYQGPSTQFERSELQGAKDFNSKFWNASYRLIRDTLFAMQSFSFGTSSTQMSSILQLAGKDFTKEDKRKALISLAGIGTSFAVFNGINVLLYKPLLAILTSLISEGVDMVSEGLGLDDDDENELNEKLKTLYQTPEDFRRALSIGATNTIIESSLPFLSQIDWAKYYVAYGVDFMAYSLGYTLYGEEMVKKYGDFGGGGFTVWQESSQMRPQTYKPRTDIGYLSIVPEDAYELYKIFNAGVTGEYDNGFGTKVYLNEKQREDAFKIAGFMAFGYGIPAIPATTSKLGVDAFRGVYHKASDNYLAAWMDDFTSLSEEKKKEVSEDFINNMNNYYKEQYDKILSQYGDEAISTLKAIKAIEYDIQDYSSTSAVKAMFAALDGKEKASEGNIDAFLFNLSNRNITPIAKGNIINQRLKKFDDKKERNEYYGRFVYSGLFLYNMDELRAIMNHVAKLNEGGNDSK